LISVITGIVRTSVTFWFPTYIEKYLCYTEQESKGITTVATFIIAFMSIIAIAVYELLGRRRDLTMAIMFALSIVFFTLTYAVYSPVFNIAFMVLAIMTSNGAAAILYSVYCPSLRDTGMVSTATGFLDFVSYMAAALANTLFANAVSDIGWGNLILVWTATVAAGLLCAIPYKEVKKFIVAKFFSKNAEQANNEESEESTECTVSEEV
jgi:sugar phosphate permease